MTSGLIRGFALWWAKKSLKCWQAVQKNFPNDGPSIYCAIPHHTDFILSVGSFTLTGWQIRAVASGLALGGVLLGIFGFCVLSSDFSASFRLR
jgi:hypothetical protein